MRRLLAVLLGGAIVAALSACTMVHQDNAQQALAQGQLDVAATEIQAALAFDPSNLTAKHLAAQIFTRRGVKSYQDNQMIAAGEDFQRAVDYEPTYAAAWDYLGLIAFWKHDWQNAISCGRKAASLSGQPDPLYVQQAEQELRKVQSGGIKLYGVRRRRPPVPPADLSP